MDRVKQYRQVLQSFLEEFAADDPEAQLIFDTERDAIWSCITTGSCATAKVSVAKPIG